MTQSFYSFFSDIAEKRLKNQKVNPGDYYKDGLLYCGKCHNPKQAVKMVADPVPDNPKRTTPLKVAVLCICEIREEEKQDKIKQAEKDREFVESLRRASMMDKRFLDASFTKTQINRYNEQNYSICKKYALKFDQMMEKNQGLLLWGDVGTGKSHAAACIANALIEKKIPVIMFSSVSINAMLDANSYSADEIIHKLNSAKLVIFDDLGAERATDTALERVYNIINARYLRKLPMIVTSNRTLQEMKEDYDLRYRRIYDRLFECCYPMQFTGPSWRKVSAAKSWDAMAKFLEE